MPQMSQVLRECAIGVLTAGMSTRAVARELNVNLNVFTSQMNPGFHCSGQMADSGCGVMWVGFFTSMLWIE